MIERYNSHITSTVKLRTAVNDTRYFKKQKLNKQRVEATSSEEKVNTIIELAIAQVENSPECSSEDLWKKFNKVWEEIASQG